MDIHNPVKLPDSGLVSPNETSSTQVRYKSIILCVLERFNKCNQFGPI